MCGCDPPVSHADEPMQRRRQSGTPTRTQQPSYCPILKKRVTKEAPAATFIRYRSTHVLLHPAELLTRGGGEGFPRVRTCSMFCSDCWFETYLYTPIRVLSLLLHDWSIKISLTYLHAGLSFFPRFIDFPLTVGDSTDVRPTIYYGIALAFLRNM